MLSTQNRGGVVELTQLIANLNTALQGSKLLPKELFQETNFSKLEINITMMICHKCWKDKTIAEEMNWGERTVQKYIREIKDKLGVYPEEKEKINERIALCREANRIGLI